MNDTDKKLRLRLEIAKAAYDAARNRLALLRAQMCEASDQLRAAEQLRTMVERELSAIERASSIERASFARRDLSNPVMH